MSHHLPARTRRSVLSLIVLSSVVITGSILSASGAAAGPTPPGQRGSVQPTPPPGTDLYHMDTPIGHYTQGDNGQVHLQLYNSPVGIADEQGWRLRDTHLIASDQAGAVAPADVPFGLHIATTSSGTLASLVDKDGVTLGVGLASINGAVPAAVAGQATDGAITYTAPVASSPSAVSLRPTVSGVDVRMVLHNPSEAGWFVLALTPDPRTQVGQAPSGVITVTRTMPEYTDNGMPYFSSAPEYFVETPIVVDSSVDPAAPVNSGPVAIVLAPAAAGQQNATVTVNPAWLHDPRRTFPVRVDVPIVMASSAYQSETFGTITNCAPYRRAPLTAMVVGIEGPCLYAGQAYFDTSTIPYNTPIVAAVLHLYTPDQAGPTNVRVYPNTPPTMLVPYQPVPWEQPSWASAPRVTKGTPGLMQSASAGQWQSWDITNLVQQWVRNERTNAGLTLAGGGPPLRFASPLGAGNDSPTFAPYVDITYAQPSAGSAAINDGALYILGVSGGFGTCTNSTICILPPRPIASSPAAWPRPPRRPRAALTLAATNNPPVR